MLTATTLERTGANNAADFAQLTPGVTIVTGTAEAGDTQVNIRGINGARDAENSIALVVDGILKTNTAQLNQVQGTLRQVEILKGPQGALYGRNAAAGALVLTTLKPGDASRTRPKYPMRRKTRSKPPPTSPGRSAKVRASCCRATTAPPTDTTATC